MPSLSHFFAVRRGALWLCSLVVLGLLALPIPAALADGDAAAGANVFARCSACHQVGGGAAHGRGPHLNGLFQRTVAGAPGYRYSDGLSQQGGQTWSPDLLRSYVSDPTRFIGTRSAMPAQRLRPDQLDDLIAFLATHGG